MKNSPQALQIDVSQTCENIETLIQSTIKRLRRDGAVIGVSGGLDSATVAVLTVRALDADRVYLLNMPERDSSPVHQRHARQLADHLGIRLHVRRITPILRAAGTYKLLPLRFIPGRQLRARLVDFGKQHLRPDAEESVLLTRLKPEAHSWVSKGIAYAIAKHRIRMMILYQYAEIRNLMVVGAANRTEWLTGTFSKWGVDHCADIMPLLHIYRSQLERIAAYIEVPDFIRTKKADPDIMPGIDDKGTMLGDFATVDQILHGIETGIEREHLIELYGTETVTHVFSLWELSEHMREMVIMRK